MLVGERQMQMLRTLLGQLSPQRDARRETVEPDAPAALEPPPQVLGDVNGEKALGIIREALQNDRVEIYLQPVVSMPQRKTAFYETFTRLRAPDGALIEPASYLAVAEQAGLVSAIDNSLLFRCVQLVRRTQRRNLNVGFFCNISPYTLRDSSFFPEFIDFMVSNPRLATNLIFEFGQSDLKSHDDRIVQNLGRLNAMGFRFSIDRVETLELDLKELIDRHVSFVKIDAGSLLEQLGDTDARTRIERMMSLLERAGISMIVEKIEEEQQVVELLDYRIDFGQGYLFGEPRLSRDED